MLLIEAGDVLINFWDQMSKGQLLRTGIVEMGHEARANIVEQRVVADVRNVTSLTHKVVQTGLEVFHTHLYERLHRW